MVFTDINQLEIYFHLHKNKVQWQYCATIYAFWKSFLTVPLSLISKLCTVVNFQNFKVSGMHEEIFWRRTYQGGKWKVEMSTHIICMLNHWMRDLLFDSFHYLVSWLLFFKKLYSLIWASCPSNKMYMKEENNRN